jgi:hypothetical protein
MAEHVVGLAVTVYRCPMGPKDARTLALAAISRGGRHGASARIIGRAVAKGIPHKGRALPGDAKEHLGFAVARALIRRRLVAATRNGRFVLSHLAEPYWPSVRLIDRAEYRRAP